MTTFSSDKLRQWKDDNCKKVNKDAKHGAKNCVTAKCMQIIAWILFTLGLCIIITTFYLGLTQSRVTKDHSAFGNNRGMNLMNELDENTRFMNDSDFLEVINGTIEGCYEQSCKIGCKSANKFYETLYESMNQSKCSFIDVLFVQEQELTSLKNNWIFVNKTIKELYLKSSNIKRIRNDAFNSPLFTTTFLLSWQQLNLDKIESGALLGLHALQYLYIETTLPNIDRAFFQPIQTTLKRLKLNAQLELSNNQNLFGISILNCLEYADLSYNNFNGPLTKELLLSVPNLKYLILTNAKITAIADDTFELIKPKLVLLNLSKNLLKTISFDVIRDLLYGEPKTYIELAYNKLHCDCEIKPLRNAYKLYRNQFMDSLYCRVPHRLYGTFLDKLNLTHEGCGSDTTLPPDAIEDLEMEIISSTIAPTTVATKSTTVSVTTIRDNNDDVSDNIQEDAAEVFQIRCVQNADDTLITPTTESVIEEPKHFRFPAASYEFTLVLLENNSVMITVTNFLCGHLLNILWFNDETEQSIDPYINPSDSTCVRYVCPYVIIDDLMKNTTYTFCLIPDGDNAITPFNCLPFYVPIKQKAHEEVWISKEHKQFTIGMLCLIFMISIFFGAFIAYFAIKAYPDLLEGSKNVLIVKKSDEMCCVSTISDAKNFNSPTKFKKKNSLPTKTNYNKDLRCRTISSSTSTVTDDNLKRISSVKSSATLFEDAFVPFKFPTDDEYEPPKPCDDNHFSGERCVPNHYGISPHSPPPLPKRNSNSSVKKNDNKTIN